MELMVEIIHIIWGLNCGEVKRDLLKINSR